MSDYLFDLCSIPIYILILWTCYVRKISKDHASRIFITMNAVSLLCAVLDAAMELAVNPVPISNAAVFWGSLTNYLYLFFRNVTLVLYLLFVFAITRTDFRIRSPQMRCLLWAPNGVLVLMLLQNLFTHNVFNVTTAQGYTRGPLMIVLYLIAAIYGLERRGVQLRRAAIPSGGKVGRADLGIRTDRHRGYRAIDRAALRCRDVFNQPRLAHDHAAGHAPGGSH